VEECFEIVEHDAARALRQLDAQVLTCDYVFLDPPYRLHEAYEEALGFLSQSRILKPTSIVIAEHDKRHDPGESFAALRRYRTLLQGDSGLSFYRLS
jgi:16S rRNA G966 N2-methylase RsmD